MFYRNGQALGSVNAAELKAAAEPEPALVVAAEPEPPVESVEPADELPDVLVDVVDVPAVTDRKSVWVDYAITQGAARFEAESLTKAELVELYGDDTH